MLSLLCHVLRKAQCQQDQQVSMMAAANSISLSLGAGAADIICAVFLQVSRIPKWQPKGIAHETHTAINTEWGRYCSNVLPRVQEDLDLDADTGNLKGQSDSRHACSVGWFTVLVCCSAIRRGSRYNMLQQHKDKKAAIACTSRKLDFNDVRQCACRALNPTCWALCTTA